MKMSQCVSILNKQNCIFSKAENRKVKTGPVGGGSGNSERGRM
jgi:hypothetical protein